MYYCIYNLMYPVFEGHLFSRILIFTCAFKISRAEYRANTRSMENISSVFALPIFGENGAIEIHFYLKNDSNS